uniref:ATG11 domain-containing protein n=1 Tax=Soboliphyme baturini TaxID=241478 RepID=A0A183J4N5_9BILA
LHNVSFLILFPYVFRVPLKKPSLRSQTSSAIERADSLSEYFASSSLPEFPERLEGSSVSLSETAMNTSPKKFSLISSPKKSSLGLRVPWSLRVKLVGCSPTLAIRVCQLLRDFQLVFDRFAVETRAALLSFKEETAECFRIVQSYVQQLVLALNDRQQLFASGAGPLPSQQTNVTTTAVPFPPLRKAVERATDISETKAFRYLKKLLDFSLTSLKRKDQVIRMLLSALALKKVRSDSGGGDGVVKSRFFDGGFPGKLLCCHSVGAFETSALPGNGKDLFVMRDAIDDAYTLFRSRSMDDETNRAVEESFDAELLRTHRSATIDSVSDTCIECRRQKTVSLSTGTCHQFGTSPTPRFGQLMSPADVSAEHEGRSWSADTPDVVDYRATFMDHQLMVDVWATMECLLHYALSAAAEHQTVEHGCQTNLDWKISVTNIEAGDLVLVVYDLRVETFVVFCLLPQWYILTESSLRCLELCKDDGAKSNNKWKFGRLVKKEYCQIKKNSNKYKLNVGCKFYRVEVQPVRF